MEDQHTCVPEVPGLAGHAFFAVYDGHGGKAAAIISNRTVLPCIQRQKQYRDYAAASVQQRDPKLLAQAMAAGFLQCDAEMRPMLPPPDRSGTLCATSRLRNRFFSLGFADQAAFDEQARLPWQCSSRQRILSVRTRATHGAYTARAWSSSP